MRPGRPGAIYLGQGSCCFLVWAPWAAKVDLHLVHPRNETVNMRGDGDGYYRVQLDGIQPGTRYFYVLDGQERPDPASAWQPEGVHGPSAVLDQAFLWHDAGWHGIPIQDYVIYELHVGTFSSEGTFAGVIPHLEALKALGVTAIELMPVAQFPGARNWGYDGVYPFAVQDSYGGHDGLRSLIDACHQKGLAVILDVVYNHMGPEGNYLREFGPYFTDRYSTPWGAAINFDGPDSDHVRNFFIQNALYWVSEFHFDALRLDALHAILDISPITFVEELAKAVHERGLDLNRQIILIGEDDLNNARLTQPFELGGYGLDAQWNDDFHHILHVLLTGEKDGYYADFDGIHELARAYAEGFIYTGQYSLYRRRRHGSSSSLSPAYRLVVFSQNHDQVGNRMLGERLTRLVPPAGLRLAAAAVILSPFIPLLFMGEEYGETSPFPYFVSHTDPTLVEAVRTGRRREFEDFHGVGEVPDPQDQALFLSAILNREAAMLSSGNRSLYEYYRELFRLRKETPVLARLSKDSLEATAIPRSRALYVRRWDDSDEAVMLMNFAKAAVSVDVPLSEGSWTKELDSSDARWGGEGGEVPGALDSAGEATVRMGPLSFVLLLKTGRN